MGLTKVNFKVILFFKLYLGLYSHLSKLLGECISEIVFMSSKDGLVGFYFEMLHSSSFNSNM